MAYVRCKNTEAAVSRERALNGSTMSAEIPRDAISQEESRSLFCAHLFFSVPPRVRDERSEKARVRRRRRIIDGSCASTLWLIYTRMHVTNK